MAKQSSMEIRQANGMDSAASAESKFSVEAQGPAPLEDYRLVAAGPTLREPRPKHATGVSAAGEKDGDSDAKRVADLRVISKHDRCRLVLGHLGFLDDAMRGPLSRRLEVINFSERFFTELCLL